MKKKITFWSAVKIDSVLSDVVTELVDNGFDVDIKYLLNDSTYRNPSGFINKILNRIIIYIVFPLYSSFKMFFGDHRTINVVTTNPFFLTLLAIIFRRNNSQVIQLVWDLYPHALWVNKDKKFFRMLIYLAIKKIVGVSLKQANANVFISNAMYTAARSFFSEVAHPVLIPVGANNRLLSAMPPRLDLDIHAINVVYSGNLGRMHDVCTFCNAFTDPRFVELSDSGLNVTFNAFGVNYGKLRDYVEENQRTKTGIFFGESLNQIDWIIKMQSCQVSLISLSAGAENAALPSKTYSSLAAGHAIVAICSEHSDLGRLIIDNDCGWIVKPGNSKDLIDVFQLMLLNPMELFKKRCNAFTLGNKDYSASRLACQWIKLFNELR